MEQMFAELFGIGWANIATNLPADNTAGGVFGVLFGIFNAVISIAALGILFYVAVNAIGETSYKSQTMKNYNTPMVVIRSVTAAVSLVPLFKGYSLLQATVLGGVAGSSLTVANSLASAVVAFILTLGGTFTDPVARQTQGVPEQMIYTAACTTFYNQIEYTEQGSGEGTGQIIREREEFVEGLFNLDSSPWISVTNYAGDRASGQGAQACGTYRVTCHDSEDESIAMCRKHVQALDDLYENVLPIAEAIVLDQPIDDFAGTLARASVDFEIALRAALDERLDVIPVSEREREMREAVVQSVDDNGFVFVGQWYLTTTQQTQKNLLLAEPTIDTEPIDQSKATDVETGFGPHLQKVQAYILKKSVAIANTDRANERVLREEKKLARLTEEGAFGPDFLSRNGDPTRFFFIEGRDFGYDTEPIVGLQKLGNFLVTGVSATWLATKVGGVIVKKTPLGRAVGVLDSDSSVNGKKGKFNKAKGNLPNLDDAQDFISYVFMVLFLAGLVLLYYIPSVPFLLWVIGIVGYLIVLIESLVAMPLWAASHTLPSGEGFASDASRRGYDLMINLFVRPPLMVIGLFAGGILMLVVTKFAVHGYHVYAVSLMANRLDFFGLFTFASLLVIEVVLVIAIVHKTHGLIPDLSDRVVEWIASLIRSTGDGQDERTIAALVAQRGVQTGEAALGAGSRANAASKASDPSANQRFDPA